MRIVNTILWTEQPSRDRVRGDRVTEGQRGGDRVKEDRITEEREQRTGNGDRINGDRITEEQR